MFFCYLRVLIWLFVRLLLGTVPVPVGAVPVGAALGFHQTPVWNQTVPIGTGLAFSLISFGIGLFLMQLCGSGFFLFALDKNLYKMGLQLSKCSEGLPPPLPPLPPTSGMPLLGLWLVLCLKAMVALPAHL